MSPSFALFRHFLLSYRGPGKAGARKTHDLPRALRAPCTRALTRSAFLSRHKCNSNPGRAGQIPSFDFELLELLRPWPDRPDPELTDEFWSRAVYKRIRRYTNIVTRGCPILSYDLEINREHGEQKVPALLFHRKRETRRNHIRTALVIELLPLDSHQETECRRMTNRDGNLVQGPKPNHRWRSKPG